MDETPRPADEPLVRPLSSYAEPGTPFDPWGEPDPAVLLDSLPDPVIVIDNELRLTYGNHRAVSTFGIGIEEGRGRSVIDLIHPDDMVTAAASLESVQSKDLGTSVEIRVRHADGHWIPVEARGWSGVHDHRIRGTVVVLRLIHDRGAWRVTAGDPRRQAAVLDHSPSMTLLLDSHGRLEGASRVFSATLGLDLESTLGRHLTDLVVEQDGRPVRKAFETVLLEGGTHSFEATFRAATDRRPVPFWLTAVNLLDDVDVQAVVISGVEIASLVEARDRLAHQATHDALTGLANRLLLLERLDLALRASVGTTAAVGLVFCDIDGFKQVNDEHGHHVGDEVLVEIARRMGTVLAPDDTPGRLGGDELVVVAIRDSVAQVEATMAAIVEAVEAPFATSAGEVEVRMSAGCAVARQGARSEDLLRRADQAMYAAKAARRGDA
jgi:diguanylate cyclase (GGDEF)-like protein/PAS domain S-box-containing protein